MTTGHVDSSDKMCKAYSVFKKTSWWPFVIFYTMMDIAGINVHVLFAKMILEKSQTEE